MQGKTVIGNQSNAADEAIESAQRATLATSDLTMMQRRVRTFYAELTEVQFPDTAPSWAPDWLEWLLTGEVVVELEVVEEEVVEETPAEGVGTPAA